MSLSARVQGIILHGSPNDAGAQQALPQPHRQGQVLLPFVSPVTVEFVATLLNIGQYPSQSIPLVEIVYLKVA